MARRVSTLTNVLSNLLTALSSALTRTLASLVCPIHVHVIWASHSTLNTPMCEDGRLNTACNVLSLLCLSLKLPELKLQDPHWPYFSRNNQQLREL